MKYLFIRIHEACNAGCWFCSFAKSNDQFRLSIEKFHEILNECIEQKVDYIRFTGGEPLLDNNLNYFIEQANAAKIKTSVITNGLMLSKKADSLAKSGLNQIIVSLDDLEKEHDNNRDIKNLFIKSIRGLSECKKFGIKTRVNTVCGPHNFKSMPKLQEIFTEIGVDYWELSALKLDSKIEYDTSEKEIQKIINHIYYEDHGLKPFGKIWCGNTKTEQKNYFLHSLPPRVTKDCSMPHRIRFYDAKNRNMYVCSLLPHRKLNQKNFYHFKEGTKFVYTNKELDSIAEYYSKHGKNVCTGCSSTASYYGEKSKGYVEKSIWEY